MTNSISLEFCSLSYLNQWFIYDKNYCWAFEQGTRGQQLEQLKKAGTFYGVARNVPLKYESGLKRFEPILDILKTVSLDGKSPVSFVTEVASLISNRYGGRSVLSLTTKFLWLKLKSPILIYDSQARKALGVTDGDYSLYFTRWLEEFEKHRPQIESISARLPQLHKYVADQENGTPEYISTICNKRWFHERIFDHYLWNLGI